MRSTFLFIILISLSLSNAFSQTDKALMTIGDQTVSLQEFERIYNKNNVAGVTEKQPVDEYLDLFINFKLKVLEAEKLGMDTAASFINELKGYRDQLAKPYLNDSATQEFLMKQEYERMKIELHVSHILLKLDSKATPADTLLAYDKLMDIRKRAMKGESFEALARDNSEDQSVKNNGGDVGWMTAFRTIWEFENAIYNTPVKQISLPIRTQYGYHLAKVMEQRASRGTVHVAHIYVRAPADMDPEGKKQAEIKINAINDSLKLGIDFAVLAKNNSDDRSSAVRGGEVPWFGAGQMIPEFEEAAFSLKKSGELSKPIHSFYGWHIIKLIDSKGLGTYEELKPELISKLGEGPVSAVKKRMYINKLKAEYNYTFNKQNFETMNVLVDTTVFSGKWSDSLLRNNKTIIFSIGTKNYSIADFGKYLKSNQRKSAPYSVPVFLNDQLSNFSDYEVQEYEKDMLVHKFPEFRYIMQEYHDGILLFDLTDKMVWSKAVQDTVGLESYYNENKTKYVWEKRADVIIFSGDSTELINEAKALAIKYGKKKKFNSEFVLSKVCKDDSIKNCIDMNEARFEKGDNQEVDKTNWGFGAGENYVKDGLTSFVFVRGVLEPVIKKLNEARGLVTADYQNFLEKVWIAELRAKYPVQVDYELLKTIK
jgi:peptidyl-prolyl cis-trans isomerase SurA